MPPYADLHDDTNFPIWGDLPWDVLSRYQEQEDNHHWCFLAEILQCDGFWRYRSLVKDGNNETVFVAFYLDSYEDFDWDQLEVGHTLAIMDANQHGFLDGTHGVRVEDMDGVYVFPVSLRDFRRLGAVINEYSAEMEAGSRKCHGCDELKPSSQMSRCGKCNMVAYCGKDCQVKGWKERDHKEHCKMFRDPNFLALMKLDFVGHRGPFAFQRGGRLSACEGFASLCLGLA